MTPADLRQWRALHQVERAQLAAWIPCSFVAVKAWETGNRNIPAWLKRALRDIEAHELAQKDA